MVQVNRLPLEERWSDGREDAVSRRQQEAKALLKLFEQKRRVSVNGRTKSPSKERVGEWMGGGCLRGVESRWPSSPHQASGLF